MFDTDKAKICIQSNKASANVPLNTIHCFINNERKITGNPN